MWWRRGGGCAHWQTRMSTPDTWLRGMGVVVRAVRAPPAYVPIGWVPCCGGDTWGGSCTVGAPRNSIRIQCKHPGGPRGIGHPPRCNVEAAGSPRVHPRVPLYPAPLLATAGEYRAGSFFPAQVGGRDSSLPSQTLGTAALTPSCCLLFMTSLRTSPEASPPSVTLPTAVVRQWDARRGAIRQVSSLGSLPAAAHNHPARQPGTAGRGGRVHAMKTQGLGSMLRKHCQPHPSVISVTHVNHAAAVRL